MKTIQKSLLFFTLALIAICTDAQLPNPGTWSTVAYTTGAFNGPNREGYVSFVIGNNLYFGLGRNNFATGVYFNDFYSYDLSNFSVGATHYSAPAGLTGRANAVVFVIDSSAYICAGGTGPITDYTQLNDVWQFTPSNPQSSQFKQMASYVGGNPAIGVYAAVGAACNGKGYMGTGVTYNSDANYWLQDWYQFDPYVDSNGIWSSGLQPFPGEARAGAVCFVVNNLIYVGTGSNQSAGCDGYRDFYYFNTNTNQWSSTGAVPDFPGNPTASAAAFTLCDSFAFVNGGSLCSYNASDSSFENYVYDIQNNAWLASNTAAVVPNSLVSAGVASTSSAGYLIGGADTSGVYTAAIYQYTNNSVCQTPTNIVNVPPYTYFGILPNPAKNIFTFSNINLSQKYNIEIINAIGQIVYQAPLCQNTVDVSLVAAGVYYVVLKNDSEMGTEKLVIER